MENKYYKQSIQRFDFLKQDKIDQMKKDNILTLEQLSNTKKSYLSEIGFENSEIDKIYTELRLLGIGIGK